MTMKGIHGKISDAASKIKEIAAKAITFLHDLKNKKIIWEYVKEFEADEKRMKVLDTILCTGLWLQPWVMIATIRFTKRINPEVLGDIRNWISYFGLSFIPCLFMWGEYLATPSEEKALIGKQKAMYPAIPKDMLYEKPTGIVLGKDRITHQYVCKMLEEDGHVFLLGGSGSGKSSCYVILALLANTTARIFAVDIKGELSYKSSKYGDKHVLIFNPSDRVNAYGYDPFYLLTENSSAQQILETMQGITYALIPLPANIKDPFWKTAARNLLLGLLIYYYRQGVKNFVSIIDEILGKPIKDSIQAVMDNAKPFAPEYRCIVQFADMEDETLGGFVAEVNNHIVIFANDSDIRYAFKDMRTYALGAVNTGLRRPTGAEAAKDVSSHFPRRKITELSVKCSSEDTFTKASRVRQHCGIREAFC